MKNFILILFSILSFNVISQSPEAFNYQCVLRDNAGVIVVNSQVGIRFTIIQSSLNGAVVYSEEHQAITNSFGLVSLVIGEGITSGDISIVDWSNGPYFIHVEADPLGGINYNDVSTTQLLSVPYALYSKTSGSSTPGPQGLTGPTGATGPTGTTFASFTAMQ